MDSNQAPNPAKLPKEYEVSPQSIEFLKYHVENDVRNRLIKFFGLPIGAGGIAAIVLGLFWFLPQKVEQYINDNPRVEEHIDTATARFLEKDERSPDLIRKGLEAYFKTDEAQELLVQKVSAYLAAEDTGDAMLRAYFAGEQGQAVLERATDDAVESDAFRRLLEDAVVKALDPVVDSLESELPGRALQSIGAADAALEVEQRHAKGDPRALTEFIERHRAGQGGVTMTLTVGSSVHYAASACRLYSERLTQELGPRFLGTAINATDGSIVAFLPPDAFARANRGDADALIEAINRAGADVHAPVSATDINHITSLAEDVSPGSTTRLDTSTSLAAALHNPIWPKLPTPATPIAVTNQGRLTATTTRSHLLTAATGGL